MGIYQRGLVWWMSFVYQGKQYRQSTGTEDKRLAKRILDKVKGEIAEGKWFEKLSGEERTFKEMMEQYMEEHSKPKKASSERDKASLLHLLPFFGELCLVEITLQLANEYKVQRRLEGAAPGTINREVALAKHAFNLAIKDWGWLKDNPVSKMRMEKEPPPRDRWLTYEEEKELLAVASPWLREIVIFAIETGCRRGELLSLEWKDVDMFEKVVTIFASKTGERRTIPLSERAFEVFKEKVDGQTKGTTIRGLVFSDPVGVKVNFRTLRSTFDAALKRAGISNFRFHDLRHTFATRLAQSGVDPYTIQKLMGHTSFSTTQRYAHHFVESLRRGIKHLDLSRDERQRQNLSQI